MSGSDPEFDQYAEAYNSALAEGLAVSGEDSSYFARGRVAWLERRLPAIEVVPKQILDFGCGTGGSVPHLLRLPGASNVIGLDVSRGSLAVARRKVASPNASFVPLSDYAPDGSVDLAFCNGVFHHIPPAERAGALRCVFDSLRSRGIFAFWENNPWNPGTRYVMSRIPFDRDAQTLTPPEARRMLQAGGFEVLGTEFLFIFPRALSWFRFLEPYAAPLPLGTQYLILARKP